MAAYIAGGLLARIEQVCASGFPGNAPNAAAQTGWIKIYVGTTAYVVPYWAAA